MRLYLRMLLLAVSVACSSVHAGEGDIKGFDAGALAQDSRYNEALTALYNLDFELADSKAEELVAVHPDDPLGHSFAASILWWKASGQLKPFAGDRAHRDEFRRHLKICMQSARRQLKSRDPSFQARGYFALGIAYGIRSHWKAMTGHSIKAYFDAKKMVKNLKKCAKADPSLADPYMGLGYYEYRVGSLSKIMRVGVLFFARGNAKRGLEYMRRAATESRYVRRQAQSMLLTVYALDLKDYPSAIELTREMLGEYPDSPYFKFIEAMLLAATGDDAGSYAKAEGLFSVLASSAPRFAAAEWPTLCGIDGTTCLLRDNLLAASSWLDFAIAKALEGDVRRDGSARWLSRLHLYRGLVKDALGSREAALLDYRQVSDMPDFAGAHRIASDCVEKSCNARRIGKALSADNTLSDVDDDIAQPDTQDDDIDAPEFDGD